jgi:hypothetical protein
MAGYGSNSSDFHTPNDPVHGKQIAHKDTNEPVLTLTKRPYGNEYDSKVHPEFEENHLRHLKDKLMPHEINDLLNGKGHGGKPWARDTKMRIASELYNKAYAAYNSHQEPRTTYKHSGCTLESYSLPYGLLVRVNTGSFVSLCAICLPCTGSFGV